MKKKILIGSMLVLTLLLLMPSIQAIQQESIEEGFKQNIQEKLDEININDLEGIKNSPSIKHPMLYFLVRFKFAIILIICERIFDASGAVWIPGRPDPGHWEVEQPILFLLSGCIFARYAIGSIFWNYLSITLGWNWVNYLNNLGISKE